MASFNFQHKPPLSEESHQLLVGVRIQCTLKKLRVSGDVFKELRNVLFIRDIASSFSGDEKFLPDFLISFQ